MTTAQALITASSLAYLGLLAAARWQSRKPTRLTRVLAAHDDTMAMVNATREPRLVPAHDWDAGSLDRLRAAIGETGVRPLYPEDHDFLDEAARALTELHPMAIQRGCLIADAMRKDDPDASDAQLLRLLLDATHYLAWIPEQIGDPGRFWVHVLDELAMAAHDLAVLERADSPAGGQT